MENIENATSDEMLENQIAPEEEAELTPEALSVLEERAKNLEEGKTYTNEKLKENIFAKKKASAIWVEKDLKEDFHKLRREDGKKTNAFLRTLLDKHEKEKLIQKQSAAYEAQIEAEKQAQD